MEEFYNNPFSHDQEMEDLCYSSVVSFSADPCTATTATAAAVTAVPESCKNIDSFGVSSVLRLQTQLSEALRTNVSLRTTYEAHIDTQRQEIDRLSGENNELLKKLTWLETQLRSLSLEKECVIMAQKREVEKNAALKEKIGCLEAELGSLERRTKEWTAAYSTTPRNADGHSTPISQIRTQYLCPKQQHRQQQQQQSVLQVQMTPSRAGDSYMCTPDNSRCGSGQKEQPLHLFGPCPPSATRAAAGTQRQETLRNPDGSAAKSHTRTEACPTQQKDGADEAVVKELEKRLLHECQRKDEIEKQLQKMERTRIRTGSERAKKISLERDLISAQRAVGDIRMRLRALSALVR
ncbi:hypothetical protein DQ04_00631040 [Trypanosoma grayi]|uniref:hypothetical protein n=1 Tax=Trypanosoma grayi TaxID=71804 RepID=UPI0004F43164|nr:hypothetical protein DQ04_00631040 [Trypanosoma grayi]KEG14080.1 hypothetical protein DQ04_00631040 [Trypanosoma grayi]